jgi:hypothetical protein
MNQMDFKNETNLYLVEPLVEATASWFNFSEVLNNKKAIALHFQSLKGKRLYAKFVREGEKSCWKMYIVDNKNVSILYVESRALNPVRTYDRNQQEKL